MHQGKLDALTGDFTRLGGNGNGVAVVTLVPKDENVRSMMSSLEVQMPPDFSATREVVMNEPDGDFTRIIFTREKPQCEISGGNIRPNQTLGYCRRQSGRGQCAIIFTLFLLLALLAAGCAATVAAAGKSAGGRRRDCFRPTPW